MSEPHRWTCDSCQSEQTAEFLCAACGAVRFPTWALMLQTHIAEAIADGATSAADIHADLFRRPCYRPSRAALTLELVARYMRLLTKDTTAQARDILKARAARMALEASEPGGERKDIIQVLKGIQVLGDVVEHKGEMITKHVVELHEGPPPKRDA